MRTVPVESVVSRMSVRVSPSLLESHVPYGVPSPRKGWHVVIGSPSVHSDGTVSVDFLTRSGHYSGTVCVPSGTEVTVK